MSKSSHQHTNTAANKIAEDTILKKLADTLPVAIFQYHMTDNKADLIYISNAIKNLTGLSAANIKQDIHSFLSRIVPEDYIYFKTAYYQATISQNNFHQEIRFKRTDNKICWLSIRFAPFYIANQNLVYQGYIEDVTDRKLADERIRHSEALLQQIFNTANVAIFLVNSQGIITRINNKMTEMFACSEDDLINQPYVSLVEPQEREIGHKKMLELLASNIDAVDHERLYLRKDGTKFWGNLSGRRFEFGSDVNNGLIGVIMDIGLRKQTEEEIRKLAFYDSLTNLPNRRLLYERIQKNIISSENSGFYGALIFIDLDNFKMLNDTKGHDIGDLLLTAVAKRLMSVVRDTDSVTRFGGDEFVILLNDLDVSQQQANANARTIANKIITKINIPFRLNDHTVDISVSLGITVFKGKQYSIEQLIKNADLAMYQAKAMGRNTQCLFQDSI